MEHKFDFEFTKDDLKKIVGNNKRIDELYESLVKFLPKYGINTKLRVAGFLAQCSHESGKFTRFQENLNYRADRLRVIFPKYFTTDAIAAEYAGKPEKIANRAYANRMGNGPESSGDGYKFRGRGLIQLTGRDNYAQFAEHLKIPDATAYMETMDGIVESACWFWSKNKLNTCCDSQDIKAMTKKINGGVIGLAERQENFEMVSKILNA